MFVFTFYTSREFYKIIVFIFKFNSRLLKRKKTLTSIVLFEANKGAKIMLLFEI
jgi:hypothetical protein